MKTSNFIILSLVVGIVAFVSAFTGYVFGARANQEVPKTVQNTNVVRKSVEEKSGAVAPKVEQPAVTQSYLLKDRDGKVNIYHKYSDGTEKLYNEYDIPVKHLPQSDRDALKEGIEVGSLSEALQLIEDYS